MNLNFSSLLGQLAKLKELKLHWQILFAILLGFIFGYLFPYQIKYTNWLGTVFIRALKMIVIPLVLTSLINGMANIGSSKNLGRLGIKTLLYYLSTSLFAIFTGLFFVNYLKPGINTSLVLPDREDVSGLEIKKLSDTLIEIVPENIFKAFHENDMLATIFFAILIGFFITRLNSKSKETMHSFFTASFDLIMKITFFIIGFAPFGIFGIIAKVVGEQQNIDELIFSLGRFLIVCVSGLLIHFVVILPLLMYLIAKINPIEHFKAMITPLLTAFSTASSNATLPLTMEHIENKSQVSNKISSFTLPLGATINMDGTALYEIVVAGFVAQLYGIDLTLGQQLLMVMTALLSSIGTAGVPMASFVTMTIVFSAVGLPFEAMALIMPIDRPLDMLRTATNVWSDTCGTVIIAKTEGENIYHQYKT